MNADGVVVPDAAPETGEGGTLSATRAEVDAAGAEGLSEEGIGGLDDFVARGGADRVGGLATRPFALARLRRLPSAALLRPNHVHGLTRSDEDEEAEDDGPAVRPWTSRSSTSDGAGSLRSSCNLRLNSDGDRLVTELAVILENVDVARRMRVVKPPPPPPPLAPSGLNDDGPAAESEPLLGGALACRARGTGSESWADAEGEPGESDAAATVWVVLTLGAGRLGPSRWGNGSDDAAPFPRADRGDAVRGSRKRDVVGWAG